MPVDYSKYHPDWKDIIRPQALKADNYRCRFCKVVNHAEYVKTAHGKVFITDEWLRNHYKLQGLRIMKVHLSISHINHDITDNRPENLQALCQQCHLRYDKEYHRFNRIAKRG